MEGDVPRSVRESGVKPGDLVEVYWNDASIGVGISLGGEKGVIDIPVRSWGIYVGYIGVRPHIVLAQNDFRYTQKVRAEDYTAILEDWTTKIVVVKKGCVSVEDAELMLKTILGGKSTRRRRLDRSVFQMRAGNIG